MLPGEKVKQNEGSFGEKNAFVVKNIKRGKRRKGIYILLKYVECASKSKCERAYSDDI